MHILILDPSSHLLNFSLLGHKETRLRLNAFETPLQTILASLPAPPDCIIQQESLAERHFVSGLEHAPCPTFFFSFDTHLNLFWHQHYARLFDAVLTPHPSIFATLPKEDALAHVFHFSHTGYDLPWVPHTQRPHNCGFCGRITKERPIRAGMLEILQKEFPVTFRDDLTVDEMFAFYTESRIVPNEALCLETNCRLFEAASAGAAILTQDCGPDQTAAFTDGKEMLVYTDGLDLLEKARWLEQHPTQAEQMGKAARERVQCDHLPQHRAATVLRLLPRIAQARAVGTDASLAWWLTLVERTTSGDMRIPVKRLLRESETLPQTPAMLTGLLRLLGKPTRREDALGLCQALLQANLFPESDLCNATASACGLHHGELSLATTFWQRHARKNAMPLPEAATPFSLCLAWAKSEHRAGRCVRPGFSFLPEHGLLPACALEFLLFAKEMAAQYGLSGCDADEACIALLEKHPAYASYRLHLLTRGEKNSRPWQRNLDIAALALRCCRLDTGQKAFLMAQEDAERRGENEAFSIALAASPARAYTQWKP